MGWVPGRVRSRGLRGRGRVGVERGVASPGIGQKDTSWCRIPVARPTGHMGGIWGLGGIWGRSSQIDICFLHTLGPAPMAPTARLASTSVGRSLSRGGRCAPRRRVRGVRGAGGASRRGLAARQSIAAPPGRPNRVSGRARRCGCRVRCADGGVGVALRRQVGVARALRR
jgi:hypothetical protein